MKYNLRDQITTDAFELLKPAVVYCGSALTIAVSVQKPPANLTITGCKVRMTNADGTALTLAATLLPNGDYAATFPASHFERYGRIENGVAISVLGADENGVERVWIERMGSLYIRPTDAQSEAGDPGLEAKYLFVNATVEDGVATLQPFANNQIDYTEWTFSGPLKDNVVTGPTRVDHVWSVGVMIGSMSETITADQTASDASTLSFIGVDGNPVLVATRQPQTFTVAVAASPTEGAMRDLWLVIKAGAEDSPTVTWPANFVPANGDADNLVAEANATTVFLISEYSPDKFIVARQVVEAAS